MKLQTIHSNLHGDVLNPSSATGFRVEDDAGRWLEVRQIGNHFTVSTQTGTVASLQYVDEMLRTAFHTQCGVRGACPKCSGTGFKNAKCPACGEGPFGRPADAEVLVFRNDGNSEADFIAHEANACTSCGGSGHRDDQKPEARGVVDALELVVGSVKWDRTDPVSVEAMRRAQVALTGERNG